jgi:hypothetical protein
MWPTDKAGVGTTPTWLRSHPCHPGRESRHLSSAHQLTTMVVGCCTMAALQPVLTLATGGPGQLRMVTRQSGDQRCGLILSYAVMIVLLVAAWMLMFCDPRVLRSLACGHIGQGLKSTPSRQPAGGYLRRYCASFDTRRQPTAQSGRNPGVPTRSGFGP